MTDLDKIIYHQTDTWPSYKELSVESNIVIANFIKKIYIQGVFKEIKRLMTLKEYPNCNSVGHIVLICICSAIDSLSAYASGGGRVGERFTSFIVRYFPSKYYGKENLIYNTFRCDGVHGWNLHKSVISGISNDPKHLEVKFDIAYISLYDFFNDLTEGFDKFYNELKTDDILKNNVLKRYKKIRVIVDKIKDQVFIG
ncbi:MAG: hypothetical protein ABH956_00120 [Candidatus Nealsonbacteria bacterium]